MRAGGLGRCWLTRLYWLCVLPCFGLLSCLGVRPATAPGFAVVSFPIESFKHESGLRVVAEQAPDFGLGAAALVIGSGSASDPKGKAGLAHLVEHLVFQSRHGGVSLYGRLERIGSGAYNGMTSWDETLYFAAIQKRNLQQLLRLWAETLREPLQGVSHEHFDHEKQIVRNEARLRTENGTDGQALAWLTPLVFPAAHPYSHPVGGTQDTLSSITLEDVRVFVKKHYRPDNTTLVLTSPARLADLAAKARSELQAVSRPQGSLARTGSGPTDAPPPERGATPLVSKVAPVPAPTLWIGWSLPSGYGSSGHIPELLAELASGSYWGNVERWDADVARVEPGFVRGTLASLFYLQIPLRTATDPETTADRAIAQLRSGLSDRIYNHTMFDLYRKDVAVEKVYVDESFVARMLRLGLSAQHTGDPLFMRQRGARAADVESSAVAEFFKRYLTEERAHKVLVRPGSEPLSSTGPVGVGSSDRFSGDPTHTPSESELASFIEPLPMDQLRQTELKSGLKLAVVPLPGSPYHTAILAFHGGQAHGKVGVAEASRWSRIYRTFPATQRGLLASTHISQDLASETLRATGSDIRLTLELMRQQIDYSILWPPRRFTEQLELFRKEESAPPAVLEREMKQALFGQHPYGATPTTDQIRSVTPADVQRWVDSVRRPKNAILVIVGNVSFEAALAAARAEFSDFTEPNRPMPISVPPPLAKAAPSGGARVIVQERPGTTQAVFRLGCVLPPSPMQPALEPELFAQWVATRLEGQLRDITGASYHVSAWVDARRGGTVTLTLIADADYARLDAALGSVRALLAAPPESLISETSFNRARAALARAHNLSLSTTASLARALVALWGNDFSLEELSSYKQRLLSLRPEGVLKVAKHCRQNWVLGLLGDEARLRGAWARVSAKPN